jgi:hypothetical protein
MDDETHRHGHDIGVAAESPLRQDAAARKPCKFGMA